MMDIQLFVISFLSGVIITALNSAFIILYLVKRIHELEKFLFVRDNPETYYAIKNETATVKDAITKAQDEQLELEKEYRRIVMQSTVSDEDIKKFGERETVI